MPVVADEGSVVFEGFHLVASTNRADRSSRCGNTASNFALNIDSTSAPMAIHHHQTRNRIRSTYLRTCPKCAARGATRLRPYPGPGDDPKDIPGAAMSSSGLGEVV